MNNTNKSFRNRILGKKVYPTKSTCYIVSRKQGDNMKEFQMGIYTLGDYTADAKTGNKITEQERINQIIEAAKLADSLDFDVFAVGESHQEHFISQAHAVILGAIAAVTKNVTLSSAATIISTSDPVRVYENFSTLDLISDGRAEIVAGRASRVGLFKLLGYDVHNYEALFDEKFDLLLKLNESQPITWHGQFRNPLEEAVLYPKPKNGKLPIWRAVGGAPYSAVEAGIAGVPMMLANLAGPAQLFNHAVQAYKKNYLLNGHDKDEMKIGITNLLHVAETDEEAFKNFFQYLDQGFKHANGHGMNREAYVDALDIRNVILVGSPETIVQKILYQYDTYEHDRTLLQLDIGGMPWEDVERMINLVAKEIMPRVKEEIAKRREGQA